MNIRFPIEFNRLVISIDTHKLNYQSFEMLNTILLTILLLNNYTNDFVL